MPQKIQRAPKFLLNSPCKLGTLTLESFSERVISTENLLAYTHCIHLDHNHVDKMVTLRMDKRFMERAWRKEAFTSIAFQGIISVDEHVSPNEDCEH